MGRGKVKGGDGSKITNVWDKRLQICMRREGRTGVRSCREFFRERKEHPKQPVDTVKATGEKRGRIDREEWSVGEGDRMEKSVTKSSRIEVRWLME